MKEVLFQIISHVNIKLLSAIRGFSDLLVALTTATAGTTLKIIDKERMTHAESAVDQSETINELQILFHINEVKDDAIRHGAWNEDHENKLNFFGTILYNEHDWEIEQVQRYIYEVIETGPAYTLDD